MKRKSRRLKDIELSYTGKNSRSFWRTINAIKDPTRKDFAYRLGCVMQEIEASILGQINSQSGVDGPNSRMRTAEEKLMAIIDESQYEQAARWRLALKAAKKNPTAPISKVLSGIEKITPRISLKKSRCS